MGGRGEREREREREREICGLIRAGGRIGRCGGPAAAGAGPFRARRCDSGRLPGGFLPPGSRLAPAPDGPVTEAAPDGPVTALR